MRFNPSMNRHAVTDFTHDGGDRRLESIRHRREDLGAGLFLATLHLAEVPERDAGLRCDLTKRATLLQAEVTKDVADFLTYEKP